MTSGYTSESLSHFVGFPHPLDHEANYATLLKVLRSGWVSHFTHTPGWAPVEYRTDLRESLTSGRLIAPTITCYCDIPVDMLRLNTTKYGLFGLAFPRTLLIKYGARPVTYVPVSSTDQGSPFGAPMLREFESVYRSLREHFDVNREGHRSRRMGTACSSPEETIVAVRALIERDFLAFLKPFDADAPTETFENFYLEREWRKYGNMRASPEDISTVFVGVDFRDRLLHDHPAVADRVVGLPMSYITAATRCLRCQQPLPTDLNVPCPQCGTAQKLQTTVVSESAVASDSYDAYVTRPSNGT